VPGQTQDVDMDLLRVSLTQEPEAVRANDFDATYATWAETHVRMHVTARLGWWDSGDRISCKWKQRELKATQNTKTRIRGVPPTRGEAFASVTSTPLQAVVRDLRTVSKSRRCALRDSP
jgi:hypothetical protein